MKSLRVFNSLSGQKETFEPIDARNVRMYCCGPTVYSRPHLGNMRSVVTADLLYRILRLLYDEKVTYARNITDVDDKIINAAKDLNIPINFLTERSISEFHQDCKLLNCLAPTLEPRATQSISEMIQMIQSLIRNGYAYEADGHVFFSVEKFQDYGLLSKKTLENLTEGARVEVLDIKKNPFDFVLWKPEPPADSHSIGWDSPFGYGRPGWHIECSAMINASLGKDFDIHCGGVDLKFPHHENEIAQSKCSNIGSNFATYWLHNGMLTIDNAKMSKSVGNIIKTPELSKDFDGPAIRLFLLSFHYRKPANFTLEAMNLAQSFWRRALKIFHAFGLQNLNVNASLIPTEFIDCLMDDLNTPRYLSHFYQIIKNIETKHEIDRGTIDIGVQTLFNAGLLIGLWGIDILTQARDRAPISSQQSVSLKIKKESISHAIETIGKIEESKPIGLGEALSLFLLDSALRGFFNQSVNSAQEDPSVLKKLLSFSKELSSKVLEGGSANFDVAPLKNISDIIDKLENRLEAATYNVNMASGLASQIDEASPTIIASKAINLDWDPSFIDLITKIQNRFVLKSKKDFSGADVARNEIEKDFNIKLVDTSEGIEIFKQSA